MGKKLLYEIVFKLEVFRCNVAPPKPGRLTLASIEELGMAKFGIKFRLPEPGADDVTKRHLEISVNGEAVEDRHYGPETQGDTFTDQWTFNVNDVLHAELKDEDGSGNVSEASVLDYTVTDTVAPAKPGEFSAGEIVQLPDRPPVQGGAGKGKKK